MCPLLYTAAHVLFIFPGAYKQDFTVAVLCPLLHTAAHVLFIFPGAYKQDFTVAVLRTLLYSAAHVLFIFPGAYKQDFTVAVSVHAHCYTLLRMSCLSFLGLIVYDIPLIKGVSEMI